MNTTCMVKPWLKQGRGKIELNPWNKGASFEKKKNRACSHVSVCALFWHVHTARERCMVLSESLSSQSKEES